MSLTANGPGGSNTMTKQNYITVNNVTNLLPISTFSATPSSGKHPLRVTLHNTSTNNPTSYLWSFGDNTSSSLKNPPSHLYTKKGTYTISLKVTNSHGSNISSKSINVK